MRPNLIATNFHVIDGAAKGYASLVNTATVFPILSVATTSVRDDLALLKVTAHHITPLPLGDSDAVQIGEAVYVAGNPLGFEGTFSNGIISGRRRNFTSKERLQMTAPISSGSSGGPVLNRNCEVIGVSTSIHNPLLGQNLNFAVPSKALKELLRQSGGTKPLSPHIAKGSYDSYLLRGYEKILSGDYEGAIREFFQAIRLNPNNKEDGRYAALLGRGGARLHLGQYSLAIMNFDAAILLKSDDAGGHYFRGLARLMTGKYSAAVPDFNSAIRLSNNDGLDAAGYFCRGLARVRLNQIQKARIDFYAALRLAPPEDVLGQRLRAAIEKELEKLDE